MNDCADWRGPGEKKRRHLHAEFFSSPRTGKITATPGRRRAAAVF